MLRGPPVAQQTHDGRDKMPAPLCLLMNAPKKKAQYDRSTTAR